MGEEPQALKLEVPGLNFHYAVRFTTSGWGLEGQSKGIAEPNVEGERRSTRPEKPGFSRSSSKNIRGS